MNPTTTVASSPAQLKAHINQIIKACLDEIALETGKELQKQVQAEWYEAYSPQFYSRTYQLLNSITNTKVESSGSGYRIVVYFDTASITPNFLANGGFNEHMGFNGAPFVSRLIDVVENGNNSPVFSRSGIHMLEDTATWLTGNLPKIVKRVFEKYGMYIVYSA
jgi:hypothetical protein